jgi:long-chain acyl-CoA synthetase
MTQGEFLTAGKGASMTTSAEIDDIVRGQTVPSAFLATVEAHADLPALRWRDDAGEWQRFTFARYADEVARYAAAYRRLGVEPGDRVVLMMRNIPEFHIADMAAYFAGATPISIYNSSSPEQVAYVIEHSGAVLAVVEDKGFLDRILPVRDRLHSLRHVAVLDDGDHGADVLNAEGLLADAPAFDLHDGAALVAPSDVATVIYTSGTTGNPKGVVLTHHNIIFTVEALRQSIEMDRAEMVGLRLLSYLPMAHIAERMTSHYQGIVLGFDVATCPDPTLLGEYLGQVRPQIMFGVPRVWEKFQSGVEAALAGDPDRKARFDEAVAAAVPIADAMAWGRATGEQEATYGFLDDLAFKEVRALIGLDDCLFAISGAAPVRSELLQWFRAVGVPLSEIYGMSETSGPMTWAARRVKPGSVGPAIAGTEVRIGEDGEMLCRGGNIFQGYLDNDEQTAEALDADGWLHTGDIAEVDEDGYYRIVDRKKELIITAGGKNVSPANLEAALKGIPLVGQACAIGDRRPFVSALVTLDPEFAPVWAAQHGIEETSLADLARHPAVVAEIDRQLPEVMSGFNRAEAVKRVRVLGEDWLPDSDVLTPTSKLKRRGIMARYEREIAELYGE